jgi:hypothetical protein
MSRKLAAPWLSPRTSLRLLAGFAVAPPAAVLLALVTYEVHPVYDLMFSSSGTLTRSHFYFEDIAGLEGLRWHIVAVVVFIAGALLFTAIFSIVVTARFVTRRLTGNRGSIRDGLA